MKCSVSDCDRDAHYKALALCQKHYFRFWRNGTTDKKTPKYRIENPQGYQWIYSKDHPLKHKNNDYVAEHRAVLFAAIGPGDMECALCGKQLSWGTCCVDHIDRDVRNNQLSNLRPTCNRCNTWRDMPPAHEWDRTIAISYEGETKTPHEWGRDPRVSLSGAQIRRRKKAGMSDEDALFAPKKTHKRRDLKSHAV